MSREELENSITRDDFHHHGTLPNNFAQTLPAADQAYRAISTFKDEYLLDFINVEELGIRDRQDLDERVVENAIIHNVKNFHFDLWEGCHGPGKDEPDGCGEKAGAGTAMDFFEGCD